MQVNLSDVPYVKIAAIVLTLWFSYRLVETNVIWNIQRSQRVAQFQKALEVCTSRLNQPTAKEGP